MSSREGLLVLAGVLLALVGSSPEQAARAQAPAAAAQTDLDRLMARVLERRAETWRTLHEYILDEVERFELRGPAGLRLHGMEREFTWYVRDGYLVRSPLRFNGVLLAERERREYEERWLREEKHREERRLREEKDREERRREASGEQAGATPPGDRSRSDASAAREGNPPLQPDSGTADGPPTIDTFLDQRGEPRFVSEAYFLRFRFEPGHYYFAGRERHEGRNLIRVEYYPTTLHGGDTGGDDTDERDINRKLNKVALVTLWVDPTVEQIVRYTFDNVDFGFLPGRWLVRVDEITASMTMDNPFEGVWLPKEIVMAGSITLASGSYGVEYARRFSGFKKAETSARIRGAGDR